MRINLGWRNRLASMVWACAIAGSLVLSACSPSVAVRTDDPSINARVRTVLLNDTEIGARAIDVQTSSGVVTISGSVRSPGEADRAMELARKVEGVRDVRSTLQVETSAP